MRPKTDHDRDREAVEFRDKGVFTDVTEGDKHEADLVARVRLSGEEAYFLFHAELQSSPEVDFPRRMFTLFCEAVPDLRHAGVSDRGVELRRAAYGGAPRIRRLDRRLAGAGVRVPVAAVESDALARVH